MKKFKKETKERRPIDEAAENAYSWWKRSFIMIKKTRIRTLKGVFILAFITGAVISILWMISMNIQTSSDAAGETSRLILDTTNQDIVQGESFDADVVIDTNNANVVAVRAIVDYDPANFVLTGWDTSNTTFSVDNSCVSNGKPCEIVTEDARNGTIEIVLGKPSPGVNTDSGKIATLSFQAIGPVQTTDDININFAGVRDYTDSDMILDGTGDDGVGTDILAEVVNLTMTIIPAVCTKWTYDEDWSACQPDGTQTREIDTSFPEGCAGGDPEITQTCTYVPPTCTSFEYSDWTACQLDGTQSRTVVSSIPNGCTGGITPELTKPCDDIIVCTDFTYTNWTACQPDGTQSRTVASSIPDGCTGGITPELTQVCDYAGDGEECIAFKYSYWTACQPDGTQSRTVASSIPDNCNGGISPVLTQSCDYVAPGCTDFTYTNWNECQIDGTQTREVVTFVPDGCVGGSIPSLTQSCDYNAPMCTTFKYSDWSSCRSDNTMTRTIVSSGPENCVGGNASLLDNCEYEKEEIIEEDDDDVADVSSESIKVAKPTMKAKSGSEKIKLSKSKKAYSKENKLSFKGEVSGLKGGKVQVFVDKKMKEEVDIESDGDWKSKFKIKKDGTHTVQFKYVDKDDNIVDKSSKYKVKIDTKKPKFTDLPLALNKRPGDIIWWRATDNNKISYYKYYFNGKTRKTKKDSFVIPANTPAGVYNLQVKVFDKAGNKANRWVAVRVR